MGRTLRGYVYMRGLIVALVAGAALALAGSAQAARVLVLSTSGQITARTDRYVPVAQPIASPVSGSRSARRRLRAAAAGAGPTVPGALQSLYAQRQISGATYNADRNAWNQALAAESGLTGTPAAELGAVIANVNQIAASGLLTPSRLAEVFLTVGRNVQW